MAAASQNGWRANDSTVTANQLVPGTEVKLRVRKDAPGLLLLEVASAFDRLVEDIDNARGALDDWGYAERPVRGSTTVLSNHASGTAIDLNATKHPLGKRNTFSPTQVARINEIVAVTGGAVTWGGIWNRPDEMHFEISDGATMADCERALSAMKSFNRKQTSNPAPAAEVTPSTTVLRNGSVGEEVKHLQRILNAWYPWLNLVVDGRYGRKTEDAVRYFQTRSQIASDGIAGPVTKSKLGMK